MLDFMTGVLPPRKLLGLVANEITKTTLKQTNHFEILYSVEKNDVVFKVYNADNTVTEAGYPEGSSIGKLIQMQALSKLPPACEPLYCIIGWHRTDDEKCLMTVHYKENGKLEKLVTNF